MREAVLYLLNNVSDGKQLLCGVSGLRQGGIVIVAGDHGAEPGVQIGTCGAMNAQVLHCDASTNLKKGLFKKSFITIPVAKVSASFKHVP